MLTPLLLRSRNRGSKPTWFIVTKAMMLLVILYMQVCQLAYLNERSDLRKRGERCVAFRVGMSFWDSVEMFNIFRSHYTQHWKPRRYDYGSGPGEYCDGKDAPVPIRSWEVIGLL